MNIKTDIGEIIRGITKLNNSSYSDVRITSTRGVYFKTSFKTKFGYRNVYNLKGRLVYLITRMYVRR